MVDLYSAKVSPRLAAADNLDYLRVIAKAHNDNLLIEASTVFTEALWELNGRAFLRYSLIYFFAYVTITGYVVLGLNNNLYSVCIGAQSAALIITELR